MGCCAAKLPCNPPISSGVEASATVASESDNVDVADVCLDVIYDEASEDISQTNPMKTDLNMNSLGSVTLNFIDGAVGFVTGIVNAATDLTTSNVYGGVVVGEITGVAEVNASTKPVVNIFGYDIASVAPWISRGLFRRPMGKCVLESINSWEFDALALTNDELSEVVIIIFTSCGFFTEFKLPQVVCSVAAVSHDVGHLGVNNAFLIKSKHEIAVRYSFKSPLENMHCAVLFEVLQNEKSNILAGLSESQLTTARSLILTTILGTDMSQHFGQLARAQEYLDQYGQATVAFDRGLSPVIEPLSEEDNKSFMLELLLHLADISNPFKPFAICEGWAKLVCEEFAQQGDREKREGMEVTPMMDRDLIILCNTQLGFIDFMVAPLVTVVIKTFPKLHEIGKNVTSNYVSWGERRKTEITADDSMAPDAKEEECRKLEDRIYKFKVKMGFIKDLKALVDSYPTAGSFDIS